jgi:hypothetical protein
MPGSPARCYLPRCNRPDEGAPENLVPKLVPDSTELGAVVFQELQKTPDVVDSGFSHAAACHQCLQPLLNRLLGVEANDLIGYLWVASELADGNRIRLRLSR